MKRILVAESDSFLSNLYFEKLTQNGYNVTVCKNGQDCIHKYHQKLKAAFSIESEDPFDIVLINETLSETNRVRTKDEIAFLNPKQKMLFITGNRKNTQQAGSQIEIIEKPFSIHMLLERLEIINREFLQNPYLNN